MCGIFFALVQKSDIKKNFNVNSIDFKLLEKRGPNSFEIYEQVNDVNQSYTLYFAASVLSLRGSDNITIQPIRNQIEPTDVLLWNGEIYSSSLVNFDASTENDGQSLFKYLNESNKSENQLLEAISSIKGPYSFVFYSHSLMCVYYGRDRVGRRSLLSHQSDNLFMLSSVRLYASEKPYDFDELNANGVYKLDLNNQQTHLVQWTRDGPLINSISEFNDKLDENFDNEKYEQYYEDLKRLLRQSMVRRLSPLPKHCKQCFIQNKNITSKFDANQQKCTHSKVALLFSGGLDSAVLAALMDEILPADEPIDLLNVAFEQNSNDPKKQFQVPDRVSGLQTLAELNSRRQWNFVEINVKQDELKDCRSKFIRDLIYPLDTVLDDSIGCAMWFASRGTGHVNSVSYQSNAEIILLGIGADEQLGGYARHRTRYRVDGLGGLINELKLEMNRIAERNLGRDDRILSYHGKESRLPYLDEDLIDFLNQCPVVYKCNLNEAKGVGDKMILRRFARDLQLCYASGLAKRAIQFGSRVAKLESSKEKASDKCARLLQKSNDED